MRFMLITAVAAAGVLAGCATSQTVQGPNGTAYSVRCPGNNIEACYAEAAKQCPSGYRIVSGGEAGPAMMMPTAGGYMLARGRTQMLVECKAKP